MQENIITDRTIIDVMAFAKASKSMNYHDAEKFCEFARTMLHEYDYLFYVSPEGVEMEDNGVRETDLKYRETIDSFIKYQLDSNKHRIKKLVHIKGSTEERIVQVKSALFLQYL
jgi:translation initiation factor 2 alpha subunit (eIF-2alpha)